MSIIPLSSFSKVVKKSKRVGRGYSSGTGKTCGRGVKGQKSRSGVSRQKLYAVIGQNQVHRSLPKRGFTSVKQINGERDAIISINQIVKLIKEGKLSNTIKLDEVLAVVKSKSGSRLKLLSSPSCDVQFSVEANSCSEAARKQIESCGGKVVIV